MAMRWSPWVRDEAAAARRGGWRAPCRRRSGPPAPPRPRRRRRPGPAAIRAMRSLSLTRSSPMPRITVAPSAKAAATARIGYSSIIEGARSAGTSTPVSGEWRAVTSPTLLAALLALVGDGQVRAHLAQGLEQAGAQRIEQHALDRHLRARGDQRRDQREGGRRRIARHADRARRSGVWPPARRMWRPSARVLDLDLGAEGRSMRSVWSRVGSGSITSVTPVGVQPGQQHRRLHLRRGLGQAVGDGRQAAALQASAAGGRRRGTSQVAPICAQRPQDPHHRPPAQGGVAGEGGGERKARRRAHDQPHAGAGVAAVDHVGRLGEAAVARAPASGRRPRRSTLGAERAPWRAAVRSTSSPSSRPSISVSPSARAPRISARWEIDLSPGARTRPRSGRPGGPSVRPAPWRCTASSKRGFEAEGICF